MNNEFQRSDNKNGNTVKIVIITVLVMIILGLVVFLVLNNSTPKDNNLTNNENNNQNNSNNNGEVVTLDINSQQVKNLVDKYGIFSVPRIFNVETSDKGLLRDLAWIIMISDDFESFSLGEGLDICYFDYDFESNDWSHCRYVTSSMMKEAFVKVFGPDIAYTDGKGTSFYYDSTSSRYYQINHYGDSPLEYRARIYKAEQKGDEIYVYIAPYVVYYGEYLNAIYQYNENLDINNDDPLATITHHAEDELEDKINKRIDKLISENKLEKNYKVTFKKQSDGKYYIYSEEWL